uniref:Uncharacterized protein n=1 Tax=Anopheles coluzzii TaxID=1518534 RepID=A0A8W7P6Q1_ANOCL
MYLDCTACRLYHVIAFFLIRITSNNRNRAQELVCGRSNGLFGSSNNGQRLSGRHVTPGFGPVHGMLGSQQARSGQSQLPVVGVSCLKCCPRGHSNTQACPLSHL